VAYRFPALAFSPGVAWVPGLAAAGLAAALAAAPPAKAVWP